MDTDLREAAYYLEKAEAQYSTPYLRNALSVIYTRLSENEKAAAIMNRSKLRTKSP